MPEIVSSGGWLTLKTALKTALKTVKCGPALDEASRRDSFLPARSFTAVIRWHGQIVSGCTMNVLRRLKAGQQIGRHLHLVVRKVTQKCAICKQGTGKRLQNVAEADTDGRGGGRRDIEALNLQRLVSEALMLVETRFPRSEGNVRLIVCPGRLAGKKLWSNSHAPSLAELGGSRNRFSRGSGKHADSAV